MEKVLELYKKEGETPLETIERFRKENPDYKDEKMTYAGRLDPMAEGVLLVLVGEECKNKEKYLELDKEYEFEILWGFKTDTYDILGIPQPQTTFLHSRECKNKFLKKLKNLKGKFKQKYPPYSSMTVGGKQLFQWAREGRLGEIEIPEKEVEVYEAEFLGNREIGREELLKNIIQRIQKVKGDFRQEEIIKKWTEILDQKSGIQNAGGVLNVPTKEDGVSDTPQKFIISKVRIKCSSGTYVRGIANDLFGAVTFSIKRKKIFSEKRFSS